MVRRFRCATGLIPVPDIWVWPRLFHVILGQLVALWPLSPHWKREPVKLLHGPGCWRPHWPHVSIGFPWTACFPLSCFISDLDLLKFLLPWELGFPGPISLFAGSLSLFLILVSSMMRATFTTLWYISWKLVYAYRTIIRFISPFNPYLKWFILISSVPTWFGANRLSSLNFATYHAHFSLF